MATEPLKRFASEIQCNEVAGKDLKRIQKIAFSNVHDLCYSIITDL